MSINSSRRDDELKDKVSDTVTKIPAIDYIPVLRTQERDYQVDPRGRTDTAYLLLLLSQRCYDDHSSRNIIYRQFTNGNVRRSVCSEKGCHRMLFFADCTDINGRVVCKVLADHADSSEFLRNMDRYGCGVGSLYVVER